MKLLAVLVVLATAAPAGAEPAPNPWRVPAPSVVVGRAVMEASMTRHRTATPLTVAPDVAVGLTHRYGVLVRQSRFAEGRIGAGNGFCVRAKMETVNEPAPGCEEPQSGLGVDGVALLAGAGDTALTARAGLGARHWAPLKTFVELGIAASARRGKLWMLAAPALQVGINGSSDANRDKLYTPVYIGAALGRHELHVRSGLEATLDTFLSTYSIPLGVGASSVVRGVRVGADFSFDKAFGPLQASTWRSASLYLETTFGGR